MRASSVALWRHLTRGFRALGHRHDADLELQDELAHYTEQLIGANVAAGMPLERAERAAILEVENPTSVREEVRASLWESAVVSAWADVRFALRTLRRNPVFTVVVVSVIAIGIGAVTTIFSGVNAYLLKPLPGALNSSELLQIDRVTPDESEGTQASFPYYAIWLTTTSRCRRWRCGARST